MAAARGRLDGLAHRSRLAVVRDRRQLELRADHPPRAGGERHRRVVGRRQRHARSAGEMGRVRAEAGRRRSCAGRRQPQIQRRLVSAERLERHARRAGDRPRPRSLCGRRHGRGAAEAALCRQAPARRRRQPPDRDARAGRASRARPPPADRHRGVGPRRLCHGDAGPADGCRGRPQPGPRARPRLGRGRSRRARAARRRHDARPGRAARPRSRRPCTSRARRRASPPMSRSPRSTSAS